MIVTLIKFEFLRYKEYLFFYFICSLFIVFLLNLLFPGRFYYPFYLALGMLIFIEIEITYEDSRLFPFLLASSIDYWQLLLQKIIFLYLVYFITLFFNGIVHFFFTGIFKFKYLLLGILFCLIRNIERKLLLFIIIFLIGYIVTNQLGYIYYILLFLFTTGVVIYNLIKIDKEKVIEHKLY